MLLSAFVLHRVAVLLFKFRCYSNFDSGQFPAQRRFLNLNEAGNAA